ncbi:lactonase family protein [Paenibacillus solisilvae]|uniref:Lactonase family protein n=1 Tax=Paenibacillus solisilvae TaxID=2486751 RepID=A0ABW0W0U0_9BACL
MNVLETHNQMDNVMIGSYANNDADAPDLFRCTLDPLTGALVIAESLTGLAMPSSFFIHPNWRYLYVAAGILGGSITAYRLEADGSLVEFDRQSSQGDLPCCLSMNSDGTALFVTNYRSGNVALLPIRDNGALGEACDVSFHKGSGPVPGRQEQPHPHSVMLHPTGPYGVVADLGIDRLIVYEAGQGQNSLNKISDVPLRPGMGPRHLMFHPRLPVLYAVGELDNTVSVLKCGADDIYYQEIQYVSTLPSGYIGVNYSADIHISPSGKNLYSSNRGHDSIVVFRIDPVQGTLSEPRHFSSGGMTPIAFSFTPDGRFLLVANKDSDSVVTFEVDANSGDLHLVSKLLGIAKPSCLHVIGGR